MTRLESLCSRRTLSCRFFFVVSDQCRQECIRIPCTSYAKLFDKSRCMYVWVAVHIFTTWCPSLFHAWVTLRVSTRHITRMNASCLTRIIFTKTDASCPQKEGAATHCNTLRHTATHATHCNTLQHTATHCNTLQHTATHCNTLTIMPHTHHTHK